jgi:hypothetical protein
VLTYSSTLSGRIRYTERKDLKNIGCNLLPSTLSGRIRDTERKDLKNIGCNLLPST